MNVLNSQGVKIYLATPPQAPWVTCSAAKAALRAGKVIDCPQTIGEIVEQRQVQEYKCLSSNESAKSLGAVSRSSFDIEVLLNPDDTAGQLMLRDSFMNNTPLIMGIEYGTTMIYFNIGVSAVGTTIAQDAAITTKFSIEISSDIKQCLNQSTVPVVNNSIAVTNNGIPVIN